MTHTTRKPRTVTRLIPFMCLLQACTTPALTDDDDAQTMDASGGREGSRGGGVGGAPPNDGNADGDTQHKDASVDPGEKNTEETLCPNAALSKGLVAHWPFDEGRGTRIQDISGSGNHGLAVEGETSSAKQQSSPKWEDGREGFALKFDGIDDWVRVASSESINETATNNAVSISAWIYVERLNTRRPFNFIVSRDNPPTPLEIFGLGLLGGLPTGAVKFFNASGPENVPYEKWVHLAMTYDGTIQRVYADGEPVGELEIGAAVCAGESPVTIGAALHNGDVNENFLGLIDDVRLYRRALRACEIKQIAIR